MAPVSRCSTPFVLHCVSATIALTGFVLCLIGQFHHYEFSGAYSIAGVVCCGVLFVLETAWLYLQCEKEALQSKLRLARANEALHS